jgi:hypothetical protein
VADAIARYGMRGLLLARDRYFGLHLGHLIILP